MIERKYVVQKVIELMDQIGDMQAELNPELQPGILAKALVVDHLMWVLELNDPELPGAALVREEWAKTPRKFTVNGDTLELVPGLYNVSYIKEIACIHPVDELYQEVVPGNNFFMHEHDRTVTIKGGEVFISSPPAAANS